MNSLSLFEVLGTVEDFKDPQMPLNRADLENWLISDESVLRSKVDALLPTEIPNDERLKLLDTLIAGTLEPIDRAITSDKRQGSEEKRNANSLRPYRGGDKWR